MVNSPDLFQHLAHTKYYAQLSGILHRGKYKKKRGNKNRRNTGLKKSFY